MTSFESISIELTKRCNLRCSFCYADAGRRTSEMGTDEVCTFLESFQQNGGRSVLFTGGEILLRKDIKDLITYTQSLQISVQLFTNGTLITPEFAEFAAQNANLIFVSLDGPGELHDQLRGVKGSFEAALRGLDLLWAARANLAIQTMLVKNNLQQLDWLVDCVQRLKPVIVRLGHVSRVGRGTQHPDLWLDLDHVKRLKAIAGQVSEACDHFHTRVVTNVITQQEVAMFYPSFERLLQPWMLPDGRIVSCYVHATIPFWTYSTAQTYPQIEPLAVERRAQLLNMIRERAQDIPCFDFMELATQTAESFAEVTI